MPKIALLYWHRVFAILQKSGFTREREPLVAARRAALKSGFTSERETIYYLPPGGFD